MEAGSVGTGGSTITGTAVPAPITCVGAVGTGAIDGGGATGGAAGGRRRGCFARRAGAGAPLRSRR